MAGRGCYRFGVPHPKTLPRLTRVDMESLHRVCGQLDAAAAVLVQSGWSGKFPVLTMLDQAKQTIAELYNRGELVYLEQLPKHRRRTLKEALAEEVAKEESAREPEAAPGQEEV